MKTKELILAIVFTIGLIATLLLIGNSNKTKQQDLPAEEIRQSLGDSPIVIEDMNRASMSAEKYSIDVFGDLQ